MSTKRPRDLTSYQRKELDEKLREKIPDAGQRGEALRRIGIAYGWSTVELAWMIDIRREWDEEQREPRLKHFNAMTRMAKDLRAALELDAPKAQEISWKNLSAALELLEASATEEAHALQPARRGPKVKNAWRDSLIAVVHGVYPAGAKRGKHIIDTVAMLLGNLVDANLLPPGADDPRDLKRTIQLAVKRPLPPALRFWLDRAK